MVSWGAINNKSWDCILCSTVGIPFQSLVTDVRMFKGQLFHSPCQSEYRSVDPIPINPPTLQQAQQRAMVAAKPIILGVPYQKTTPTCL